MNKSLLLVIIITVVATVERAHAGPNPPRPIDSLREIQRRYEQQRAIDNAVEATYGTATQTAVDTGLARAQWGITTVRDARELWEQYQALSHFDAGCMDLSTLGAPEVPASCDDDDTGCASCYQDAYRELDDVRFKLEKLRCIYTATKRFADKSISFGDSASGIHAVSGLAWQKQRVEIVKSIDGLNASYDTKLREFLPALRTALDHVARCEEQVFNERDWYTRFGYIYFTFMSDRYKRKD